MTEVWVQRRMTAFDLETTAPDPEEARIVTAAVVRVGGGEESESLTWLADPGIEIPTGASEVHGVTTEAARAEGRPAIEVIEEVIAALEDRPPDTPLIVFNARYDLTVLDREARRHGLKPLGPALTVDPLVIDKWIDRYRPGSRKLEAMCEHYGARLEDAHAADFDAIAAARLAWAMVSKGKIVRRVRDDREANEKRALEQEWEEVRFDLRKLHAAQKRYAAIQAAGLAEHFMREGNDDWRKVRLEWPLVTFEEA